MTPTPDAGRQAVARLITQARHARHWSQADLAAHAGMSEKTITNNERAAHPPRPATLAKFETALGLIPGSLTDVLEHHAPDTVTLDQVQAAPAAPLELADISDAALIWELTQRLQDRTAQLERLRATPAPPAATLPDTHALAADLDRSGHGRHLADQADAAGEEPQG